VIYEVIKRVKTVHDVARSNVELTQSKNKEYYDKKTKLPNFKGGDRVLGLIRNAIITLGKILDQYSCSFEQYALKD
jgi:hypothetical protein